jgi:hypothetical protein
MATAEGPRPRDIVTSRAFERDLKRLRKRGFDLEPLWDVVEALRLHDPSTLAIVTTRSRGSGKASATAMSGPTGS